MKENKMVNYIQNMISNMPKDWLNLTTHRLDIYNEEKAKTEFLEQFEDLFNNNNFESTALSALPTAFDYIRLGHPLSCVLEWHIAKLNSIPPERVISFSSQTTPIFSIFRKNLLENINTRVIYSDKLPKSFNNEVLTEVYGYNFSLVKFDDLNNIKEFDGSTVFINQTNELTYFESNSKIDFIVNIHEDLGSVLLINGDKNQKYSSEIQHVRRRETIAMTPSNCLIALKQLTGKNSTDSSKENLKKNKESVYNSIRKVTDVSTFPLVASSGLSVQYAILMGLVHDAKINHKGKAVKIIVPPNCYGGTNDQARRVAECIENVEVMDLPVDGGNDMVKSIDLVLNKIAQEDAVPYIIAEIPTNPRVEVPNLTDLRDVLSAKRKTKNNNIAVEPVFILDQTFCPNVHFLGSGEILSSIKTISFASGSKFPSGGLCTAGYCIANKKADPLMEKIALHLEICDNEATSLQYDILAKQIPSMNQRIHEAYLNTRDFVNFIKTNLPEAKINFVSEELANQGFTPSVFSLDLPTKGNSDAEREEYKRALNLKLIDLMITQIPNESKYCVSYGQLKGCYWTIPATSTQGTTKEGDKDYIARVALSANMDLDLHKKVFLDFINSI